MSHGLVGTDLVFAAQSRSSLACSQNVSPGRAGDRFPSRSSLQGDCAGPGRDSRHHFLDGDWRTQLVERRVDRIDSSGHRGRLCDGPNCHEPAPKSPT